MIVRKCWGQINRTTHFSSLPSEVRSLKSALFNLVHFKWIHCKQQSQKILFWLPLQILEHIAQGYGIILSAILLINETLCKVTEFTLLEFSVMQTLIPSAQFVLIFLHTEIVRYLLDFTWNKHSTRKKTYKRNLKGRRM